MKKALLDVIGFCGEALLGTRRLPAWENFKGTRLYRRWEREARLCLRPDRKGTFRITTHDGLYELKTIVAVAVGWGANYRTDYPYSGNEYAMFLSTKDTAAMCDNLIEPVLRYRYEMTRYGEPLVDWSPWRTGARATRSEALPAVRTNQMAPANQIKPPADDEAAPGRESASALQAAPELSLAAKEKARR